ncbi:hypothetical protein HPB48_022301 [Haemaphysalis longicornis]|uniref:RING-type domain-containing protein n=1 Tax=Haemaphysalis longicornis TaxID=44386 RepID=A0A9J6FSI7_HAELO|nr:hypothetical protein HPB48_022301 [Haemaphysalis longicornis]
MMASGGHEYTLVGFSQEVDRRPLVFVEALPATKLCSACGIVPKVVCLLPCEHFFCKQCYEQCERSGRVTCPLDVDTCSDEEVTWITHQDRSVLAKQALKPRLNNGRNINQWLRRLNTSRARHAGPE